MRQGDLVTHGVVLCVGAFVRCHHDCWISGAGRFAALGEGRNRALRCGLRRRQRVRSFIRRRQGAGELASRTIGSVAKEQR